MALRLSPSAGRPSRRSTAVRPLQPGPSRGIPVTNPCGTSISDHDRLGLCHTSPRDQANNFASTQSNRVEVKGTIARCSLATRTTTTTTAMSTEQRRRGDGRAELRKQYGEYYIVNRGGDLGIARAFLYKAEQPPNALETSTAASRWSRPGPSPSCVGPWQNTAEDLGLYWAPVLAASRDLVLALRVWRTRVERRAADSIVFFRRTISPSGDSIRTTPVRGAAHRAKRTDRLTFRRRPGRAAAGSRVTSSAAAAATLRDHPLGWFPRSRPG